MTDQIRLRTALDKAYRPLDGDFLTTVLVELSPPRAVQRLPLNLGLLVDTSESMAGDKLQRAREACLTVIEGLEPNDLVSVVAFNSHAQVLLRSQTAGPAARRGAADGLSGLRAEGVTALMRGLDEVYSEVRRRAGPDRSTFVVLISDGYPTTTQGYVDEDQAPYVRRVDREMRDRGVSLTTIGLGDAANYDQAFLRRLADTGNGQFLYCSSPEDLAEQFRGEFQRIQRTVLGEVSLTLRHLQGTVRRLWRVFPDKKLFDPPSVEDGVITVPLGTLQDEQSQAYLIDVVTTASPNQQPGRGRLVEVEVSWFAEGRPRRVSAPVVFEFTDHERALAQRDPEVVRLASEALDALLENQLEQAVASGDPVRQTAVLARKKQLTMRLGKSEATRVLEEMEDTLAQGGTISQDALARSSQATRPTQRLG